LSPTQGLSEKSRETAPDAHLSWRVHLLVERPLRSAVAIALLAAFLVVVLLAWEPVFFLLSVAFFLVSLAPFFFPAHYELTPDGPCRRILGVRTVRRWSEFRSFAWGRDGARLSTTTGLSWLGNLRGFSLRFAGNREEVLDYLRRHLPAPAARAATASARGTDGGPAVRGAARAGRNRGTGTAASTGRP